MTKIMPIPNFLLDISIFNYGDISTCSFHATKLFHTGEGGAIICKDADIKQEIWYRHNFGHDGYEDFHGLGINAKMSELQAAMGLCVFPYIDSIVLERKKVCNLYDAHLDFKNLKKLKIRNHTQWNYSYYPIIFESEKHLKITKVKLEKNNIFPRRYFYPSLENLPYVNSNSCAIANSITKRVLCLPNYVGLKEEQIEVIVNLINDAH
jgi:dTDP-4-amino-4,6-dideoxygalactose transaminase